MVAIIVMATDKSLAALAHEVKQLCDEADRVPNSFLRNLFRRPDPVRMEKYETLLVEIARVAENPRGDARVLLREAQRLTGLLDNDVAPDSWQNRTQWIYLAQLNASVGNLAETARSWLKVAVSAFRSGVSLVQNTPAWIFKPRQELLFPTSAIDLSFCDG